MPEEKKSTYKGNTDAHRRGNLKYLREKVDTIRVYVPKGKRETIKAHATQNGESMNGFITRAIDETIKRDSGNCQTN